MASMRRIILLVGVLIVTVLVFGIVYFLRPFLFISKGDTKARIPGNERAVTQMFDQTTIKQNWSAVYALCSSSLTAQYTETQFAQMMQAQEKSVGKITSIVITSAPHVQTSSAGIIYYTVTVQITLTKTGLTKTQDVTSVFVLEQGRWKFWFTKAE